MSDQGCTVLKFDEQVFGPAANRHNASTLDAFGKLNGKGYSQIGPALLHMNNATTGQVF